MLDVSAVLEEQLLAEVKVVCQHMPCPPTNETISTTAEGGKKRCEVRGGRILLLHPSTCVYRGSLSASQITQRARAKDSPIISRIETHTRTFQH